MIIEEQDFKLELNEANGRFDLYLLHVVNAKDPDKRREEFKINGYGMPLKNCMKHIINYRINKQVDTMDLKEYIQMYKEIQDELTEELSKLKGNE